MGCVRGDANTWLSTVKIFSSPFFEVFAPCRLCLWLVEGNDPPFYLGISMYVRLFLMASSVWCSVRKKGSHFLMGSGMHAHRHLLCACACTARIDLCKPSIVRQLAPLWRPQGFPRLIFCSQRFLPRLYIQYNSFNGGD